MSTIQGWLTWLVNYVVDYFRGFQIIVIEQIDGYFPAAPPLVSNLCTQYQTALTKVSGVSYFMPWVVIGSCLTMVLATLFAAWFIKTAFKAISLLTGGGGAT